MATKPRYQYLPILLAGVILAGIKFWLVSGDEILARHAPHDQLWFIQAASHLLEGKWFGPYGVMTLIRPPAYPLWIFTNYLAGIPLRWGSEFLLIASAAFFSLSLAKAEFPRWFGLLVFATLIFFPETFVMNNEAESETFYLPMLLFMAGFMNLIFSSQPPRKNLTYSFGLAIALACLWQTRHEHIILIAYLLIFAVLQYFSRHPKKSSKEAMGNLLLLIAPAIIIIFLSNLAIDLKNKQAYGVQESSEILAPGFVAAVNALASIETGASQRYVSIPRKARLLAYSASPSFQKLEPLLEGELGKGWQRIGCQINGVCDDIGSAWFQWAFRESADKIGAHQSAVQAEAYYQGVADEIQAACREGKIPCHRPAFNSFGLLSSGDLSFLRFLPEEFLRLGHTLFQFNRYREEKDSVQGVPSEDRALFDRIARRNPEKTVAQQERLGEGSFYVGGWAANPGDPIAEIQLRGTDGEIQAKTSGFFPRPDVNAYLKGRGWNEAPTYTGFELAGTLIGKERAGYQVAFLTQSGQTYLSPLLSGSRSLGPLEFSVDLIQGGGLQAKPRIKKFLVDFYNFWGTTLSLTLVPSLFLLALFRKSPSLPRSFWPILALAFSLVSVRLALITVYSASVFSISQNVIRFLYPVAPIYFFAIISSSFFAVASLIGWRRRERA